MHLLTFVIWFIVASILHAFKGDYSGLEAIGKFLIVLCILYLIACIS